MTSVFETPRLILSPYTDADADALVLNAGPPEVARMMASIPQPFTREAALARIARQSNDAHRFTFAIRDKASGEAIGEISAGGPLPDDTPALGYFLRPTFQGQGLLSEVIPAILDHAFRMLGWSAIEAETMDENPASARILTKFGFQPVRTGTCPSIARDDAPPSTRHRLTAAHHYTPVLRTDRLTLRPRTLSDAPRHAALLNDHAIVRMLSVVPFPYAEADSVEWLSGAFDGPTDSHLLIDDGSGPIGVVSLSFKSPTVRSLGFWLGAPYHGKGLATEAVGALIDWGVRTHGLEKIVSVAFMDNTGSRRIHEKLGFVETGTRPLQSRARDAIGEAVTLELTRTDWTARR